jgi:hypothetical protein
MDPLTRVSLRTGFVFVLLTVLFASCSSDEDAPSARRAEPTTTVEHTVPTMPATTTTLAEPQFDAAVVVIDDAIRARMTASWRPGCPVAIDDLRLLTLDHWGYDGVEHAGELVVHRDHADAIVRVFRSLFAARFPIERMDLVDVFNGDDAASTRANNTAGFNCRSVVGRPGVWSEHASGLAIDLNPLVNPYTLDPNIRDPELAPYLDRGQEAPGIVRPGDAAVVAFAAEGWTWGGSWQSPDYQHFSATGR